LGIDGTNGTSGTSGSSGISGINSNCFNYYITDGAEAADGQEIVLNNNDIELVDELIIWNVDNDSNNLTSFWEGVGANSIIKIKYGTTEVSYIILDNPILTGSTFTVNVEHIQGTGNINSRILGSACVFVVGKLPVGIELIETLNVNIPMGEVNEVTILDDYSWYKYEILELTVRIPDLVGEVDLSLLINGIEGDSFADMLIGDDTLHFVGKTFGDVIIEGGDQLSLQINYSDGGSQILMSIKLARLE